MAAGADVEYPRTGMVVVFAVLKVAAMSCRGGTRRRNRFIQKTGKGNERREVKEEKEEKQGRARAACNGPVARWRERLSHESANEADARVQYLRWVSE